MKRYMPLALGLIDESRFIVQANTDLLDMQAKLLAYLAEHGPDAKGAKARLTIEIALSIENVDDEIFGVRAQTKVSLPARPASVTLAISNQDGDGKASLFVRASGSDEVTPRQGKLATDDGRLIDPETGAALRSSDSLRSTSKPAVTSAEQLADPEA